jgi:L-2-hydroxyglutarate oxidase LhgO
MKPAARDYDYAIIGGGIVGLATARELLLRAPGARLAVLEKEPSLALHQTGHNSGVIHTGVYYRPGSLKARLCVNGRAALLAFCDSKGIPYELGGKLIVAVEERERPLLDELEARGRANGVAGITRLANGAIREREPHATGIAALWIPGAGIIDYVAVAKAIAEELSHLGADVLLDHEVLEIRQEPHGVAIRTSRDPVRAKRVVACSGLQCDRVAALSGDVRGLRIIPFRGDYYRLRPEARSLVRSMIYPVPDPRYPFLGVHFTRRINGDVWAGPNAVLTLAREQYGRAGFALRDAIDIATWPGLWHIVRRHWRMGASELWRDWVKEVYARDLARYVPEIQAGDLMDGPCGIRAQAVARDGTFIEDFAIARNGATLHVMNAPSPAATSSFAIAGEIADRVRENGGP